MVKLSGSFGHGVAPSEIVEAAKTLELSGFSSVLVSESTGFDSLAVLGAIANQTKKIGLASAIVNVYSRTPTQLAMAAATIDELSKGRFALGIGASSKSVVFDWHGLEYSKQMGRIRKTTEEIKTKLGDGTGRSKFAFRTSESRIPILFGAVNARMVLLAKEIADGVLFFLRPISSLKKDTLLSSDWFTVCASVVTCVSSDPGVAELGARRTVAFYLTYGDAYRRYIDAQSGLLDIDQSTLQIREHWIRGKRDEAARLVPQDLLSEVTIFGTPSQCRRTIEGRYLPIKGLSFLGMQFNPGEKSFVDSLKLYSSLSR